MNLGGDHVIRRVSNSMVRRLWEWSSCLQQSARWENLLRLSCQWPSLSMSVLGYGSNFSREYWYQRYHSLNTRELACWFAGYFIIESSNVVPHDAYQIFPLHLLHDAQQLHLGTPIGWRYFRLGSIVSTMATGLWKGGIKCPLPIVKHTNKTTC